ncbi:unnamed protein product, partial [Pylaiella littoralis]
VRRLLLRRLHLCCGYRWGSSCGGTRLTREGGGPGGPLLAKMVHHFRRKQALPIAPKGSDSVLQ